MKRSVKITLLVIWMAIIFFLSAQAKVETTNTTNFVVKIVYSLYKLFVKNAVNINTFVSLVFKPIRKIAHFSEYLILAILMYLVYNDKPKSNKYIWPFIFTVLYAISDEIHQYFVPGRACTITDMLIDTSGALLGTILIHLLLKRCKRK